MTFHPTDWTLVAWVMLAACAADSSVEAIDNLNACQTSADCGTGVCADDVEGALCVATKADLDGLLFELDIPTTARVSAGARTVVTASALGLSLQGEAAGGFVRSLVVPIAEPLEVSATLRVDGLGPECSPLLGGTTVRASIEVHPVGQPLGVSLPSYGGAYDETTGGPRVSVPAGRYDIFLKPSVELAPDCALPPVLLKDQLIDHSTQLNVTRPLPAELVGHLDVPHPTACDADPTQCWRVELLDNQRGRVIGAIARLDAEGASGTERFRIAFFRDAGDAASATDPVLVVRPTAALKQVGMPDLYWKLSAIDPDGDLDVTLQLSPLTAATQRFIPLEASVRSAEGEPVTANVLLASRQLLAGTYGDNALFQAAVTTNASGNFAANILPGKYDVVAIPSESSDQAITVATWTFGDEDLGKGRTFEVKPVSHVRALTRTLDGRPVSGVAARVSASATEDTSLLESAFSPGQSALLASLPRTASAYTDANGSFDLPLDPGQVDLSVRPMSATRLPWLVRRRIGVTASEPQTLELGVLAFTHPVVVQMTTVATDGTPLAGVTVRAWLPTASADLSDRPSAIGLGEATSDAAGRVRLLLPASVLQ